MIKIDTLVWFAVVAMVMAMAIVQGVPTGAKSNSRSPINSKFDQVMLLDTTNNNESLKERLRQLYESQVSNTTF
ncbi:hypothetical protein BGZ75_001501, partial [Mortierella antarctica]